MKGNDFLCEVLTKILKLYDLLLTLYNHMFQIQTALKVHPLHYQPYEPYTQS